MKASARHPFHLRTDQIVSLDGAIMKGLTADSSEEWKQRIKAG